MRVPAGFMRNKTQERIEELARERAATAIDLALVEDGIELGKKMMAEMIATYSPPASTGAKHNLQRGEPADGAQRRRPAEARVACKSEGAGLWGSGRGHRRSAFA